MPTRQDIANLLRSARERLTPRVIQGQVGEAVGVAQTTISDWEKGISYPRKVSELKGLARVLQLSPSEVQQLEALVAAVDEQEAAEKKQSGDPPDLLARLAALERRVDELAQKQAEAERLRELARQRRTRRPRSSAQR